jgi:hypothetical protein
VEGRQALHQACLLKQQEERVLDCNCLYSLNRIVLMLNESCHASAR